MLMSLWPYTRHELFWFARRRLVTHLRAVSSGLIWALFAKKGLTPTLCQFKFHPQWFQGLIIEVNNELSFGLGCWVSACVCFECAHVPVPSIMTSSDGGGGRSPSSSASFLSQSVTQIRSTVANTLPRAQNFLFPFQPSISPYVSMFSRQCLLPLYISLSSSLCRCLSHTLIDANRCKNALRLHLLFLSEWILLYMLQPC